jgi:hypothetical protein
VTEKSAKKARRVRKVTESRVDNMHSLKYFA